MIPPLLFLLSGWFQLPPWLFVANPSQEISVAMAGVFPLLAELPLPPTGTFEPFLINTLLGVSIIGAFAFTWVYVRDAFGRKPAVDEELAAFKQRVEDEMVTHEELDQALKTVVSEVERKFERALHEEFKQLNGERSRSIAGLHEKVEDTAKELREQITKVSDEMPGKIIRLLKDTGHLE